jgi:hypothetical protein
VRNVLRPPADIRHSIAHGSARLNATAATPFTLNQSGKHAAFAPGNFAHGMNAREIHCDVCVSKVRQP